MITETKEIELPKVGDIFRRGWGYDQTQYDYLIITKLSPSGKTVMCKRVTKGRTADGEHSYPTFEQYGPEFRMKVDKSMDEIWLRGSYVWDISEYPICKVFRENGSKNGFNCTGNVPKEEIQRYHMWIIPEREERCKGCQNFIVEKNVSKQKGSFRKWNGDPIMDDEFSSWGH